MNKFLHFLRYDNSVPIVLGIIFLGATGTYAATNPEVIYRTEEHVLSVDNTYLANKDLHAWTPRVEIIGVTEDAESYFVAYRFSTIDNNDYVWQDVVKDEVMTVSKADLGQYRDLGVYVTQQLKQKIDRELARLKETQEIEKKQISQKMVATAYGGIVGKFLDDTTETLPGYSPVVTPPAEPPTVFTEALPPPPDVIPESTPQEPTETPVEAPAQGETLPASENASSTLSASPSTGLAIQILGENPARVAIGGSYSDLGAVATNAANDEIDVAVFVNSEPVSSVAIDTTTAGTWTIRYAAEDASGIMEATRTVEVYDPAAQMPAPEPDPAPTSESASSTPPAEPATEPQAQPETPLESQEPLTGQALPAEEPAAQAPVDPAPEAQLEPTPEPEPTPAPAPAVETPSETS